ncbi:MAG: heme ABC exporter ATP-binding protein CcmA [Woeseiaceae bacterium]
MSIKLTGTNLTLFRGDRCLFKGLSFALNPGELLLLEGRNGSGKTSLLRAIAGLIELESGEIELNDSPVRKERQFFQNSMVLMSHKVGLKGDLNLVENLQFEAALRPQSDLEFEDILQRLGIIRLKRLPIRSLSAGQQRRVALARLLMSAAPLWMMDEPVSNLDSEGRVLAKELIAEHLQQGGSAIVAAHQDIDIDVPTHRIKLQ